MSTSIPLNSPDIESAHVIAQRLHAVSSVRLEESSTASGILTTQTAARVLAEAMLDAIAAENRACQLVAEECAARRERSGDTEGALVASSLAAALRERCKRAPQVVGIIGGSGRSGV